MAIYLLETTDKAIHDSIGPNTYKKVVCARGVRQARVLASYNLCVRFDNRKNWLHEDKSTCIKLDPGYKGVICEETV